MKLKILILTGAVLLTGLAPAGAQQTNPSRAGTRPASEVLSRIGQGAGAVVLADSTVAGERLPLPTTPATPENVEQQIAEAVKALPPGATVAKLYLPAPAGGRAWNGDDVAGYAFAQARLFGGVGAAPAGTVEILGQRIPADRAQAHLVGLNLKPVYLVTNPNKRAASADMGAQWAQMTPEQRQQYAQQQAARLAGADNNERQRFMQEHMLVMGQLMRQLSPEQRQQMMQGSGAVMVFKGGPGGQDTNIRIGDPVIVPAP